MDKKTAYKAARISIALLTFLACGYLYILDDSIAWLALGVAAFNLVMKKNG